MNVLDGVSTVLAQYMPQLRTLLALVLVDVVLGIALAVKKGQFSWYETARFYQTNVVPLLIGWVAFAFLVRVAVPETMGGASYLASEVIVNVAWGAGVMRVASSVVKSAKEIYGEFFPDEAKE